MNGGALLHLDNIGKSFFGVPVLRELTLTIGKGRVLGLVGQNGAGKSTLMNIVGGNLTPDSGAMSFEGRPYTPQSARDAEGRGIAFIHQELNLFTNLSVAENIFISAMPRRGGLIDLKGMQSRAEELLREVGLDDVAPETLVERLSPGERQLVEVAKAVQLDAHVVIFDEPTTSLTPRETTKLFALIGRLRQAGKAIIYISHILGDVEALADDVAVLRDGRLVGHGPRVEFHAADMIKLMLGREIDQLYPTHINRTRPEILLDVRNVSLRGVVRDINLTLHRGEVLGVFGLMGAGRTELTRILFGLDHFHSGELWVNGKQVTRQSPQAAIRSGMAFITENRREEGLMMNASISENIALASLGRLGGPMGMLDRRMVSITASELATALQIKSGPVDTQVARSLSGGNQQKVVIGKWLASQPSIFMLDEPTRGIDVAAKFEIYTIINKLAEEGSGILLISSEIEEAMEMCDRIIVMRQGEISGSFLPEQFGKESILRAAFGEEGMAV